MEMFDCLGKDEAALSVDPSNGGHVVLPVDFDPRWLEVERLVGVQPGALVEFETDRDAYAMAHPEVFRNCLNEPDEFTKERFLEEWLSAHDECVYIDRHTSAEDFLLFLAEVTLVKASGVSMRPALDCLLVPAGGQALDKAEDLLNAQSLSLFGFNNLDDAFTYFVIPTENETRLDELLRELEVVRVPYDTGMFLDLWPWLDTEMPRWVDRWPA